MALWGNPRSAWGGELITNFFIDDGQTKYLNALLDKISKKIRNSNG